MSPTATARTSDPKRQDAIATRARIVAVAERLFAERGIDAVSLSEINREANQRNRTAVQYHFGNKHGLLEAILQKHRRFVHRRRTELLDELEAMEEPGLRDIVRVLVLPIAELMSNQDGGLAFVQVRAQLIGHPEFRTIERATDAHESTSRLWSHATWAAKPVPDELRFVRALTVLGLLFHTFADYARVARQNPQLLAGATIEATAESVIDSIVAVLSTHASEETRRAARGDAH